MNAVYHYGRLNVMIISGGFHTILFCLLLYIAISG